MKRWLSMMVCVMVAMVAAVSYTHLDVYKRQALSDPNYLPDSGSWYYIVFFLIGIVGYFCVPTVAGWIIEAGGGIDVYKRQV